MKIAICTPCHSDVTAEYAYSLARLVARTAQTQLDFDGTILSPTIELFMRSSSVLPQLRNMLVQDAMDWGAHYLLWVDSDHKFPDNALLRLLSLNRPVVGANYPRRVPPHLPTAVALDGSLVATTEADVAADAIVPVASMGLGFCLIDMTVFDRMQAHAQAEGRAGIWPLFATEMLGDGTGIVGEDAYFFRQLLAAGVPVAIDQALSWTVGHVQQRVLSCADMGREATSAVPVPVPVPAAPSIKVRFDRPR